MDASQELLLVWKQPISRQRYLIGHLWHDQRGYHFRYELKQPRSLHTALSEGFRLFEPFPTPTGTWSSTGLFPLFRRRLPPAWRNEEIARLGIAPGQAMDFFRMTGGRLPTDTLEFLEPIQENEDGTEYTVRFPVAGWRYHQGDTVIDELTVGTQVNLELEPDNEHDPSAIRVLSPSGVLIGYVPAIFAWYLDDVVVEGNYRAVVQEIGCPEDPQVRLTIHFKGYTQLPMRRVPTGLEEYAASLPG